MCRITDRNARVTSYELIGRTATKQSSQYANSSRPEPDGPDPSSSLLIKPPWSGTTADPCLRPIQKTPLLIPSNRTASRLVAHATTHPIPLSRYVVLDISL